MASNRVFVKPPPVAGGTMSAYSSQCSKLRNIQSMIRLTKGNLEQLNARFAEYQHPPSMYVHEYEDLTSKLNEFQNEEQRLVEMLTLEQPLSSEDAENFINQLNCMNGSVSTELSENGLEYSPLNYLGQYEWSPGAGPRPTDESAPPGEACGSSCSMKRDNSNLSPPTPKSPYKSVVRVYLPNHQRSTIQVGIV